MWAIVLGALMALAGLVVLGHVLVATVVSVVFLGWVAVLGGLAGIVASLYRLGKPRVLADVGAILALVVGIAFLRRPGLSVVGLTLLLALMIRVSGLTRIIGGIVEHDVNRGWVIAHGVISLLLGLLILFGWPGSTLWVLGTSPLRGLRGLSHPRSRRRSCSESTPASLRIPARVPRFSSR